MISPYFHRVLFFIIQLLAVWPGLWVVLLFIFALEHPHTSPTFSSVMVLTFIGAFWIILGWPVLAGIAWVVDRSKNTADTAVARTPLGRLTLLTYLFGALAFWLVIWLDPGNAMTALLD